MSEIWTQITILVSMFYDPDKYHFTQILRENFDVIKEEMIKTLSLSLGALNENTWAGERPGYLTSSFDPTLAWKTYALKFWGINHMPNQQACPKLMKILDQFPFIVTAEFSMLEPGTHIQPHRGYTDKVLRSHLGLIVPIGELGIKVGEETRKWEERDWLVFDDSIMHEAWNKTAERRIVLMVDFVPDLSEQTGEEVCREVLGRTNDKHMMDIAPREAWLSWFENKQFPV